MKATPPGVDGARPSQPTGQPMRLLDKDASARYLSTSTKTIERLVHAGVLPIVKLPVERGNLGRGQVGTSRRVLIDMRDLDALIERSKEPVR